MGLLDNLMQFLEVSSGDTLLFSLLFLIYTLIATIFLPIPVELGLFFSPGTPMLVKAFVMGLGKMLGSMLVFIIGMEVGGKVRERSEKWRWFGAIARFCEWMVNKFHYVGLYVILSIPMMFDTVPLYLFSLFNQTGAMKLKWFALVNFFAGMTRAAITFLIFAALGIMLV